MNYHGNIIKKLHSKLNEYPISEKDYKDELKTILSNDWILSWHWRAVLPSLQRWNPLNKEYTTIIQISHFRKWEMLLCYKVKTQSLKSINALKDIPLNEKELLRAPPLFGISHRLTGWDTYRLFYSDDMRSYIDNKVQQQRQQSTQKRMPTILGRHDCYYIIEHVEPQKNGYEWQLKCSIEPEPEITKINKKDNNSKTYIQPLDFIEIPSFGNKHVAFPPNYYLAITIAKPFMN